MNINPISSWKILDLVHVNSPLRRKVVSPYYSDLCVCEQLSF